MISHTGSRAGRSNLAQLQRTASKRVIPTGLNLHIVTGQTESIMPGCWLSIDPPSNSISVAVNVWTSQYDPGKVKNASVRLRRSSVSGQILRTDSFAGSVDSTDGHRNQVSYTLVDKAPTDGVYVVTVQETSGSANTLIYSDTSTLTLTPQN